MDCVVIETAGSILWTRQVHSGYSLAWSVLTCVLRQSEIPERWRSATLGKLNSPSDEQVSVYLKDWQ